MLERIIVFAFAFAATLGHLQARDVLARCYLDSRWHTESVAAWNPNMVRRLADVRRTVSSAAQLARLRTILRIDRFQPRQPWPDDFCFVADIRQSDGTVASHYAGRFYVISADYRRGTRIDRTAFRRDIDAFMGVAR